MDPLKTIFKKSDKKISGKCTHFHSYVSEIKQNSKQRIKILNVKAKISLINLPQPTTKSLSMLNITNDSNNFWPGKDLDRFLINLI
jgi:hypothetical protein